MSASLDALVRAIDALEEPGLERREPQGATRETPVVPSKPLESKAGCHKGHRSHSKTTDHGPNHQVGVRHMDVLTQPRTAAASKVYLSDVAPVAHVAPRLDSKGKNRGHTPSRCGPLWPLRQLVRARGRSLVSGCRIVRWSQVVGSKVKPTQVIVCLVDLKVTKVAHDPRHSIRCSTSRAMWAAWRRCCPMRDLRSRWRHS